MNWAHRLCCAQVAPPKPERRSCLTPSDCAEADRSARRSSSAVVTMELLDVDRRQVRLRPSARGRHRPLVMGVSSWVEPADAEAAVRVGCRFLVQPCLEPPTSRSGGAVQTRHLAAVADSPGGCSVCRQVQPAYGLHRRAVVKRSRGRPPAVRGARARVPRPRTDELPNNWQWPSSALRNPRKRTITGLLIDSGSAGW